MSLRHSDLDKSCTGIFGLLFGHKFKTRYDIPTPILTKEAQDAASMCRSAVGFTSIVDSFRAKMYRGDVCERCGEIRNTRPPEDEQKA